MESGLDLSLVCPAHNEASNVGPLIAEWNDVLAGTSHPYEIVLIDDGSTDRTLEMLRRAQRECPAVRVLRLMHRSGQSAALVAGFEAARGDWIVTSDADLQNDPHDLPRMLAWAGEFDLICGWRQNRRDPWIKRVVSRIANVRRRRVLGDAVHDTGCGLKLMRRELAQRLLRFDGMHRFIPALAQIEGFRVTEVPVNHRPRVRAASKYTFWNRLRKPIEDLRGVAWYRARHITVAAVEVAPAAAAARLESAEPSQWEPVVSDPLGPLPQAA